MRIDERLARTGPGAAAGAAAPAGAHAARCAAAARSSAGAGSARSGRTRCCARRARSIGGVPVAWWAVWDGERAARAHAPRAAGPVRMAPGHVRARRRSSCASRRASGVEVVSPHGAQYIWTRKQGGIPMRGTRARPAVRGPRLRRRLRRLPRAPHRLALVGRRRRRRVGRARSRGTSSTACTTRRQASERTVWVDGEPHHGRRRCRSPTTSPASATCAARPVAARAHARAPAAADLRVRDAVRALQRLAAPRRAARTAGE